MALTRKFLTALGIDADKIDEIIAAHSDTVNGLKSDIDKYKTDAEKLPGVQKELDDLKKDGVDKNYDTLKAEYDKYKADVEAEKVKARKSEAYREALKDANLSDKGIEKAVKYATWDGIELGDDGKLKNAQDLVKAAREEWAEYIVKQDTKGAQTTTPPATSGGGSGKTMDEIMAIEDAAERQKAIAENHELFGF